MLQKFITIKTELLS